MRLSTHTPLEALTTFPRWLFPEVYMNGDRPARRGVIDETRHSLRTPAYGFGWILSNFELFEALEISDEPPTKMWMFLLPNLVDDKVYARWEMKGYDDYRYK